ncbi:MAG: SH3 domain-containing protein [Nitrospira sp.]|nr:SH3 domain-containing protein [Nitrospira sp.]MBH0183884.1 SH3 domain-containing protein [Nitrospira sp.]
MFATAEGPSFAGRPLTWNLFFARQPEPDLEFTEEELEQTMDVRSSPPKKSPKKSGGSPLIWIFLLVAAGGGAYVAMEPEMVMDVVGPLLGETPEPPPQPPVARKPAAPKPPLPNTQPSQPQQVAPAPDKAPVQPLQAAVPAPAPTPLPTPAPVPSMPAASAPAPTAPKSLPIPTASAPPTVATPDPLFTEGQRVTVLPNPGAPNQKVSLRKDAEGSKIGPAIPPGTAFTILDGDLQEHGWVYYVQSNYGTKGWLAEKQLKRKP